MGRITGWWDSGSLQPLADASYTATFLENFQGEGNSELN